MQPGHTLNLVGPFELHSFPREAKTGGPGRLLVISLALNGGLALGAGAAALSLHAQLEDLSHHTQQYAKATDRYAQGLTTLGNESRALADGLVDVRTAVASHSREEALFLKLLILRPTLNHALARRIAASVQRECLLAGQDPNLVLAIMSVESDFNPRAVSPVGALGLMQVMPFWKKVLEVDDLSHPETSIHAGVQILLHYQQLYDDVGLTLAAYNRGPTAVNEALANGENPANGYSAKVLALWQRLTDIDVSTQR
ncbi:MAG: lytic transglycosylase domain-containing protein [Archangium sp.]|nr:lytic transglycosylase domain-containing protein [Archangium sp.]